MKQTKLFFLLVAAVLLTGAWSHTAAQVKIGGDPSTGPASGAVLDLSASTAGGLLLPQVTLTTATALPIEWTSTVANTGLLESGLMVYNLGGSGLDAGVYVWQGTNGWALATSGAVVDNPPTGITVSASPSGAIAPGATQTLTATVSPINAGWTTVNWGGNNTAIATVVSTGLNTATVTGVAPGNTTVIASLDGISSASFSITVNPILASGVSISGGTYAAPSTGGTATRTAAITNASQATNKNINWTSNNAAVTVSPTTTASGGSVTITVASGTAAVNATVTATAADASGQSAAIAVTRAAACSGTIQGSLCWMSGNYSTSIQWADAVNGCSSKAAEGGKSWYLPSKDQLVAAYNAGVAGFSSSDYWSSTEYGSDGAYFVYMINGTTTGYGKTSNGYARCVRSL